MTVFQYMDAVRSGARIVIGEPQGSVFDSDMRRPVVAPHSAASR